jgi:hypothetical protein
MSSAGGRQRKGGSPDQAEVLAAFRAVTGWSDEDVLHYASCGKCTPICGSEEENCPESPAAIAMAAYVAQRSQRLAAAKKAAW